MMLEDDCVKGTCDFMATDAKKLTKQTYNLGALDFTEISLLTTNATNKIYFNFFETSNSR